VSSFVPSAELRLIELDALLREGVASGQIAGSLEDHGRHSLGFAASPDPSFEFSGAIVDLGSGVGLPSLVLAEAHPATTWTLVERRTGRAELLRRSVARLRWSDRVEVLAADAADAGRGPLRGRADIVTARSFGPPASVAELGAPLLAPGGSLIVSEPLRAAADDRWPASGLDLCGLEFVEVWETDAGAYVRLRRTTDRLVDLPRAGARKRLLF